MKELWVKKTIWRRYLIEDENIYNATETLRGDDNGDVIVADCWDKNEKVEYDNEEIILPVQFNVAELVYKADNNKSEYIFKVGDLVICTRHGKGKVITESDRPVYFISCKFDNGKTEAYSSNGRLYETDYLPSLKQLADNSEEDG